MMKIEAAGHWHGDEDSALDFQQNGKVIHVETIRAPSRGNCQRLARRQELLRMQRQHRIRTDDGHDDNDAVDGDRSDHVGVHQQHQLGRKPRREWRRRWRRRNGRGEHRRDGW